MVKNNEYVNKRNVKLIKVLNKTRVLVECPFEVGVMAKPVTLERLFEMYTFLDDEPCGVMEK